MKKPFLFLQIVLFALWSTAQESTQYSIGQESIIFMDESRNRPLDTEIWYPTLDKLNTAVENENTRIPFFGIPSIRNATWMNKKFPTLLVSHGTGGNRFSLTWFAEHMVREGYIVIAVDHYGNTSFNKIPREFVKWWERPIDIQYILSSLIAHPKYGSKIDTTRIGGVGFSLGGYTNIALAGGYVDRRFPEAQDSLSQRKLPPEFPQGEEEINFDTDSLIVASYTTYKDRVKDPRMKAFFVMAPAIGFGFHSSQQTKHITAPVFIVAGKGDRNTPIADNALKYHRLIRNSELYLFNEFVDHYVFLNQGTPFGKEILPHLTVDHPSVNRAIIHKKTSELALQFFKTNLK